MVEDIFFDFFYGVMVAGLEGALAGFQYPAHFLVWHFIVIPEVENKSLLFRELLDSKLEFPFQFIRIEVLIGPDLVA